MGFHQRIGLKFWINCQYHSASDFCSMYRLSCLIKGFLSFQSHQSKLNIEQFFRQIFLHFFNFFSIPFSVPGSYLRWFGQLWGFPSSSRGIFFPDSLLMESSKFRFVPQPLRQDTILLSSSLTLNAWRITSRISHVLSWYLFGIQEKAVIFVNTSMLYILWMAVSNVEEFTWVGLYEMVGFIWVL